MTAAYLPPVPRPPHDPLRLPLDPRAGWSIGSVEHIESSTQDGALVLAPVPGTGRLLNEASGSFGGLTTPLNVAIAADGSIFLLDRGPGRLKHFDPCRCRFDTVPCLGGQGADPRQVSKKPGGIGICGGNLFIADSGNRRVAVFSLRGMALRGLWSPPPVEGMNPWRPVDVAFDRRGDVLVGDRANGCVHVFHPGGRWLRCIEGLGAVKALVTDCDDRVYVLLDEEIPVSPVTIVDLASGTRLGSEIRAARVAGRFWPLPFPVTEEGLLQLGGLCVDPSKHGALFDLNGRPVDEEAETNRKTFEPQGIYRSAALDSQLYRCIWDRVSLTGQVPRGTRVTVYTHTAETELDTTQIENLPDDVWATERTVYAGQAEGGWDCLIRSAGGRYLWLKLVMTSDGHATPRITRLVLDFPRISLRRYLPAVFGEEPVSADFTDRFLAVFDRGFRQLEGQLDRLARYFDPLSAPAEPPSRDFLSWLGSWIGFNVDRQLPLARRRLLLKAAGKLFPWGGTACGLQHLLELYLGLDRRGCAQRPSCGPCATPQTPEWQPPRLILEHFKLRRWLFLGVGRLGDQAKLWGQRIVNRSQLGDSNHSGNARLGVSQLKISRDPFRDPFHVYAHAFSVFVPAWMGRSVQRRKSLQNLIAAEKPAHTLHHLVLVEPRFRIGIQSMIGFDAAIGCYPQGVTLDRKTRLGRASVLGPAYQGGPELEIGVDARIGTTTKLN